MIYLVQPPLVQLNAPYPSIYYLRSFLEKNGYSCIVSDHSIALFERIFCRQGTETLFADARRAFGKTPGAAAENPYARYNIERFLSESEQWTAVIDRLVNFLRGKDREFAHLLTQANGVIPGGPRYDSCLEAADGQPGPDSAPVLASRLLADLADFITVALDPSFSLVRYAEHLSASVRDFSQVTAGLDSYILNTFYRPFLQEEWRNLEKKLPGGEGQFLLGATIPFPGCLAGALVCAESAKEYFGDRVCTAAGGGYVNTELRSLEEDRFFDYFDYLCFDRGYGSLRAVLDRRAAGGDTDKPLYKTMYRPHGHRSIVRDQAIENSACEKPREEPSESYAEADRDSVKTIFPDYTGIDFSRYIYPVDDANPMHRLWSDGHWLKAYLAHGCYWHACAFCDVQLDYIRGYSPADPEALFAHLKDQAEKTGVRGVHLVDEAAPAASLVRLAELNRAAGLPLEFWGNIRFEKAFTPDTAALLAAGGLIGVSAGIEVASEQGFKRIGKGITLREVVRACAAFKEAGILTHAYLIYGYWDEQEEEIIDSAETMRQLFSQGLLDSAFWHKFVLTRHSRIYAEWKRGRHGDLAVTGDSAAPGEPKLFANNDLRFEGEEQYDKFTAPLDALLSAWMNGDTETPVDRAFPFKVPAPSVPADTVTELLDAYARDRDQERAEFPADGGQRLIFLGSSPMMRPSRGGARLFWRWRLADHEVTVTADRAAALKLLLEKVSRNPSDDPQGFMQELREIIGAAALPELWNTLRNGGLALY
ncbi:B12-binding domain-containing radical SAM protein [Breznakiella homolactica]|uniref:Radical SAM protein n=1 Tax=Breznakiella homolactica TaxID=2798577 RepID=A0A7T7XQC6_9SPIR|nr:radical SAM protein [Breznakiella homolactica]QQO10538.1 radical SAM protein [Breznakiella homolactica]